VKGLDGECRPDLDYRLHSFAQFEWAHELKAAVSGSHVGPNGLSATHASWHATSEQSHWSEHASTAVQEAPTAAYSEAHLLVAHARHTVLSSPVAGGFLHQPALDVPSPLPLPEHAVGASTAQVARNADQNPLRLSIFLLRTTPSFPSRARSAKSEKSLDGRGERDIAAAIPEPGSNFYGSV
jgi:hypothetical protein